MARKKITVVGAGNVGANAALWIALKELGDVVLMDIVEGMPQGKALDMMEAAPHFGFDSKISGTNDYKDTADSDVIVITAGLARKPGMSRADLIEKNTGILKGVVTEVVKYSPNAILIIVTNPLDVMVHVAWKASGLPPEKVMGMAGALDSSRFRSFIAMELNASMEDVDAMVICGHADSMVPRRGNSTVSGVPITKLLSKDKIDAIIERTKTAGGEIVALLKTGSAYYAPSASTAVMVEAILKDKKRLIPTAAYCDGKYGLDGVYVGVPARLGIGGVEEIVEIELEADEKAAFDSSVDGIKKLIAELNI